jgi:hypothetical protein
MQASCAVFMNKPQKKKKPGKNRVVKSSVIREEARF